MIRISGPALVLRQFTVSTAPSKPEPPVVEIEGRKPGLISFVLTILGIDNTTRLAITRREISFRTGSLFGEITSVVPLTAVASAHSGFAKPIAHLIAAAIIVLLSVGAAVGAPPRSPVSPGMILGVGLAVAAVLLVSYILGKKMALFVESSGGTIFGLVFKRGVIEGVPVDIDKVKAVVEIIRELVIASQAKGIQSNNDL